MNILRNTTDVYKPYWHVSWYSLCKVYMMFGYSHCNTDELHFNILKYLYFGKYYLYVNTIE
jgi:hypothetical protein